MAIQMSKRLREQTRVVIDACRHLVNTRPEEIMSVNCLTSWRASEHYLPYFDFMFTTDKRTGDKNENVLPIKISMTSPSLCPPTPVASHSFGYQFLLLF